jgi:predicted RNase H-like nuclease
MAKYRTSKKSVSESVWAVVEAVNNFDEFIIEYPDSEEVQLEIACKFQSASEVNFSNCAGAIDGILIWI